MDLDHIAFAHLLALSHRSEPEGAEYAVRFWQDVRDFGLHASFACKVFPLCLDMKNLLKMN